MKNIIATIALIATATTSAADDNMFAAFDAADEHRVAVAAYPDCAEEDLATLTGASNEHMIKNSDGLTFNHTLGKLIVEGNTELFTLAVSNSIKDGRVSVTDAKASATNVLAYYNTYFN